MANPSGHPESLEPQLGNTYAVKHGAYSLRVQDRHVKAAARKAGVPWAGLHSLRHTCATRLFRAGLNAKQVQVWLGHHSPAFTLATYVHLLADDLPNPAFLDNLGPRLAASTEAPQSTAHRAAS